MRKERRNQIRYTYTVLLVQSGAAFDQDSHAIHMTLFCSQVERGGFALQVTKKSAIRQRQSMGPNVRHQLRGGTRITGFRGVLMLTSAPCAITLRRSFAAPSLAYLCTNAKPSAYRHKRKINEQIDVHEIKIEKIASGVRRSN